MAKNPENCKVFIKDKELLIQTLWRLEKMMAQHQNKEVCVWQGVQEQSCGTEILDSDQKEQCCFIWKADFDDNALKMVVQLYILPMKFSFCSSADV